MANIAKTIHGDGLIINKAYELKTNLYGNLTIPAKKGKVDIIGTLLLNKGNIVTMIQHTESTFSCFKDNVKYFDHLGMKDIECRWESDLLKYNKNIKTRR